MGYVRIWHLQVADKLHVMATSIPPPSKYVLVTASTSNAKKQFLPTLNRNEETLTQTYSLFFSDDEHLLKVHIPTTSPCS